MPSDERVSPKVAEDGPSLARERARALVRALARERQALARGLQETRAELRTVVLAAVEGLEAIGGIVEALSTALPPESASALDTTTRAAWERLEAAGVVRDGTVGERVDVARHKVLERRKSSNAAPDTVLQVVGAGIVYKQERLRDAAVVVSKAEKRDAAHRD